MNELSIKINMEFTGFWHIGSGQSMGPNLDAVVLKSPSGLPIVPGKTIKGLFREGVQQQEDLGLLGKIELTSLLFGTNSNEGISRFASNPGIMFFDNATLGLKIEEWASLDKNQDKLEMIYRSISSTSINEKGIAANKSLRSIEVTIPLKLSSTIRISKENKNNSIKNKQLFDVISNAASLTRQIGSYRHRGLGRVILTVEGDN